MSRELNNRINEVEETLCDLLISWWTPYKSHEGQEAYTEMLNKIKEGYLQLWRKTTLLERKLGLAESGITTHIYSNLRDKVKSKLLNKLSQINMSAGNSIELKSGEEL